jgi:Tfp pilus assembly protein PilO
MRIDRPITIAITLFVILLLIFFSVLPEYNKFKQLETQLGEKKAEFNAKYDYYSAITKTYLDLQAKQDEINKIDSALPKEVSLGELTYFLQKTVVDSGLVAKDLYVSKTSSPGGENLTEGGLNSVVFSLNLVGDYPSLTNFIKSLERSARIFVVDNISFGSSSNPPYSFSLQVKTFFY